MDADSAVSAGQRHIELQSPEDLAYLVANVRGAAAARLNEAFPVVEGHAGGDELRDHIEAMVNEYINKTFSLAAPNLTINGLPVSADIFPPLDTAAATPSSSSADPTYEPFDTRKRRRVADLITQEEKLLEEVAALKRSVPARAAAEHAARLDGALARDQAQLDERVEAVRVRAAGQARLDVATLERQEGVEERWRGAVEGLDRLKRDMPAVVAKMERARVAGEYVVTQGR